MDAPTELWFVVLIEVCRIVRNRELLKGTFVIQNTLTDIAQFVFSKLHKLWRCGHGCIWGTGLFKA